MLCAVPPVPTHLAVRSEADFRVYEVHLKAPHSPCQCVCIFVSVTVKRKATAQLSLTLNYFLTPNYLLAIPSVSDSTVRMTLTERNTNAYESRSRIAMVWVAADMQHLELWVNIYCETDRPGQAKKEEYSRLADGLQTEVLCNVYGQTSNIADSDSRAEQLSLKVYWKENGETWKGNQSASTMVLLHVTTAGVPPLLKLYSLLLDNLHLCFVISMMA